MFCGITIKTFSKQNYPSKNVGLLIMIADRCCGDTIISLVSPYELTRQAVLLAYIHLSKPSSAARNDVNYDWSMEISREPPRFNNADEQPVSS